MSKRIGVVFVLLLTAIVPCLVAQEAPQELPRIVSVLGDPAPGEVRFRLTEAQLENVGIPEVAYTEEDRFVADLAEVGLRVRPFVLAILDRDGST